MKKFTSFIVAMAVLFSAISSTVFAQVTTVEYFSRLSGHCVVKEQEAHLLFTGTEEGIVIVDVYINETLQQSLTYSGDLSQRVEIPAQWTDTVRFVVYYRTHANTPATVTVDMNLCGVDPTPQGTVTLNPVPSNTPTPESTVTLSPLPTNTPQGTVTLQPLPTNTPIVPTATPTIVPSFRDVFVYCQDRNTAVISFFAMRDNGNTIRVFEMNNITEYEDQTAPLTHNDTYGLDGQFLIKYDVTAPLVVFELQAEYEELFNFYPLDMTQGCYHPITPTATPSTPVGFGEITFSCAGTATKIDFVVNENKMWSYSALVNEVLAEFANGTNNGSYFTTVLAPNGSTVRFEIFYQGDYNNAVSTTHTANCGYVDPTPIPTVTPIVEPPAFNIFVPSVENASCRNTLNCSVAWQ